MKLVWAQKIDSYLILTKEVFLQEPSVNTLQQARLAYPEAAWIATCGNNFPSNVQWLHKFLAKVDVFPKDKLKDIVFENSFTTLSSKVMKSRATTGSGKTSEGFPINEQVSLDWVKWALSKRVWSLLYNKEKVSATESGKELILNEVKYVLDAALEQGIFTTYTIKDISFNSNNQSVSIKFIAELQQTILNVEVSGSLFQ